MKQSVRRALSLICAASVTFSMTAWGSEEEEGSTKIETSPMVTQEVEDQGVQHDEIVLSSQTASSLEPWNTRLMGGNFIYQVYEMLFEVDGFGREMYPVLADGDKGEFGGYDHEEGTSDYTVYICDNIYDSAGNHITADDVIYSFQQTYASGMTSGWDAYSDDCMEKIDDYTVTFHFSRELNKVGELLNIFARCFIASEAAAEASPTGFTSDACGTGPYELTDYQSGASATITKRDDYWQTDTSKIHQMNRANVDTITYRMIDDSTQYVVGLETGDLDIVEGLDTLGTTDFADGGSYSDQYNVFTYFDNGVKYLLPNCSDSSILSDVNMRLAVFYAIDNTVICSALGEGVAEPCHAIGNELFSDYDTAWDTADNYENTCDIELSKEYQEKAGYDGEPLQLICMSAYSTMATVIQGMLQNAGINCEISNYEYGTLMTMLSEPDDWDLFIDHVAADDYIVNLWSHAFDNTNTDNGMTTGFVDDDTWQELLDTAKIEDTHTTENVDAWWDYCVENAYAYGICTYYKYVVYPSYVKSLAFNDKTMLIPGGCTYSE